MNNRKDKGLKKKRKQKRSRRVEEKVFNLLVPSLSYGRWAMNGTGYSLISYTLSCLTEEGKGLEGI